MVSKTPVFAVEGHDVTAFIDRVHAGWGLEPIDVERNTYRLFTSDGTELRLSVERGQTVVTDDVLGIAPEFLADRLRYYLRAVPPTRRTLDDQALDKATLAELVDEFCSVEPPE